MRRILQCSTLAALVLMATQAWAVTLFEDNFDGNGGPLNGTTPDVTIAGEVWEAGDTWLDNGIANSPIAGGPNGQAAHLDFTPVGGVIYTAEALVSNPSGNWIGFGFLPADPAGGDWTVQDFSVRHSNAPGYAWVLSRTSSGNDQEGFLGGGTAGGQPWNGDVTDASVPVQFRIVLDTTAANWTAEWFINGSSMGAPVAYAAVGNPGIGGIGFSHDRSADPNNGGSIGRFSLTVVPEPASALLALGGVGFCLAGWGRNFR